ncbi:MAG: hypothetical protein KBT06_08870 [Prevotellaceae bacterium]|nr:hypothetical protein [Candidatus Colivivens equi]MCQ2075573.1 hypothetical protein [Bacteroidaceae bacterium]
MNINCKVISSLCLIAGEVCFSACQESIGERLERETRDYTEKNCPQRFDKDGTIILDSLVFHNDGKNDYTYYYSIAHTYAVPEVFDKVKDETRQSLLNGVKNSVELRHIKAEGLNIIYIYKDDSTHQVIASYKFTKMDYE